MYITHQHDSLFINIYYFSYFICLFNYLRAYQNKKKLSYMFAITQKRMIKCLISKIHQNEFLLSKCLLYVPITFFKYWYMDITSLTSIWNTYASFYLDENRFCNLFICMNIICVIAAKHGCMYQKLTQKLNKKSNLKIILYAHLISIFKLIRNKYGVDDLSL